MDQELKDSILKTGTSLVVVVCKNGVVMASDRQVTAGGRLVVDKNFPKTNQVNNYLVVSWAGLVSGAQRLSKLISAELKLKELKSRSRPSVKQSANLVSSISYSTLRQMSMVPNVVETFVGGVNEDGSCEAYEVSSDGALLPVKDYAANGSGMPYILGLLERQYKENISVDEGVELAKEALEEDKKKKELRVLRFQKIK